MHPFVDTLVSNSIVALVLGALALVVWRWTHRAPLAHAILVLAVVKLITPAVVPVGIPLPGWANADRSASLPATTDTAAAAPIVLDATRAIRAANPGPSTDVPVGRPTPREAGANGPRTVPWLGLTLGLWALGAAAVGVVAWRRGRRFACLLEHADGAPERVLTLVDDLVRRLDLRSAPAVRIVDARVSPLVFRWRRRATVVLPNIVVDRLDDDELRAVLAHELSHLAQGDHLTRLVELCVAVVHWWNPVAHWVRRLLRETEELRCDARAIGVLASGPRHYGRTILKATSHLEGDFRGLPLGARGLGGARTLKKRLMMIAEQNLDHRVPLWTKLAAAASAIALLPLGLTAQEGERTEKKRELAEREAHDASRSEIRDLLRDAIRAIEAEAESETSSDAKDALRRAIDALKSDDGDDHGRDDVRVLTKSHFKFIGPDGEVHEFDDFEDVPDELKKKLGGGTKSFTFDFDGKKDGKVGWFSDGAVEVHGIDDLPESARKALRSMKFFGEDAHGDGAVKVFSFEGLPEGFGEHAEKALKGKQFKFFSDDDSDVRFEVFGADEDLPEHVQKALKSKQFKFFSDDDSDVRFEVFGADEDLPEHIQKVLKGKQFKFFSDDDSDVRFELFGAGEDLPEEVVESFRVRRESKRGETGADVDDLRKKIAELEAQIRELKKAIDK